MTTFKKEKVNDWGQENTSFTQSNSNGKIRLTNQPTFSSHRSGWNYAIHSISSLHNKNGVDFYGFLENEFSWFKSGNIENGTIPIKNDWIGFFHNPQSPPWWFSPSTCPITMLQTPEFLGSLETCKGLFALSEYHAAFLREMTGKPVEVLLHPTEIPEVQFDFDLFYESQEKRLINIGYWLRKVNSIYSLPITQDSYIKTRLLPYKKGSQPSEFVTELRQKEFNYEHSSIEEIRRWYKEPFINIDEMYNVSNEKYDELFSKNIIYLDMYDSSANNAVIECIARATPLLINPIPAVVEYLGPAYPFYFESFDEAVDKLHNPELIYYTHEYLRTCQAREKMKGETFLKDFQETEIYKSI